MYFEATFLSYYPVDLISLYFERKSRSFGIFGICVAAIREKAIDKIVIGVGGVCMVAADESVTNLERPSQTGLGIEKRMEICTHPNITYLQKLQLKCRIAQAQRRKTLNPGRIKSFYFVADRNIYPSDLNIQSGRFVGLTR